MDYHTWLLMAMFYGTFAVLFFTALDRLEIFNIRYPVTTYMVRAVAGLLWPLVIALFIVALFYGDVEDIE